MYKQFLMLHLKNRNMSLSSKWLIVLNVALTSWLVENNYIYRRRLQVSVVRLWPLGGSRALNQRPPNDNRWRRGRVCKQEVWLYYVFVIFPRYVCVLISRLAVTVGLRVSCHGLFSSWLSVVFSLLLFIRQFFGFSHVRRSDEQRPVNSAGGKNTRISPNGTGCHVTL